MNEADMAPRRPRGRILVVDDSSLVRLYCRECLERAGFEVDQAINGLEAMEKILAQTFDLVIVDVNMPRMDGISFRARPSRQRLAGGFASNLDYHHRSQPAGS